MFRRVGMSAFASIGLGLFANPAVAQTGGAAYAWGAGASGALGNAGNANSNAPVAMIGLGSGVTAVAAGGSPTNNTFTLAVQNGTLFGSGYNAQGQLGLGTNTSYSTPEASHVAISQSGVTAVAGGEYNSGYAIINGGLYAFGGNALSQLGTGGGTTSTPTPVLGLSSGVTAVSAGAATTIAVMNGTAYTWGSNNNLMLGNGTTTTGSNGNPTAVPGLTAGHVTEVAMSHTLGIAVQDGTVYTWGSNGNGQNAYGAVGASSPNPTAISVGTLATPATSVAAGGTFGLAVVGGTVFAWGGNTYGQMGNGTYSSSAYPPAAVVLPGEVGTVVKVAAGNNTAYALTSSGQLYAWGNNEVGELGIGSSVVSVATPTLVAAPTGMIWTGIDAETWSGTTAVGIASISPTPEPATLGLVAASGLGLVGLIRRRARGKSA